MADDLPGGPAAVHLHNGAGATDEGTPGAAGAAASHTSVEDAIRCRECGLRALQLMLTSPSWVRRRVESVSFRDNRTVRRRVSVDFSIPPTAPSIEVNGGMHRLVPLTLMRRKTLVNFDLRDESDASVSLLGLRENQALTESLVCGLAAAVLGHEPGPDSVKELTTIISGTQEMMMGAYEAARSHRAPDELRTLMNDRRFRSVIDRLTDEFALMVLVPEAPRSSRVYKFRYDEPLTFTYRKAPEAGPVPFFSKDQWLAALGWKPTRIRFPTPAAEAALTYHFEINAPEGVEIASASILAGWPHGDERPSFDAVAGGFPTVGLHVVDVPTGSRSRAQVDLHIAKDSWLLLALAISFITALALWYARFRLGRVDTSEGDSASALFITFTAGSTAILWRPGQHRMAVRLASKVNALAYGSSVLLLMAAALFVYEGNSDLTLPLAVLATTATIVTLLLGVTFISARRRVQLIGVSPWEQGRLTATMQRHERASYATFAKASAAYGYDGPAIQVASAEAYSLGARTADDSTARALCHLLDRLLPSPATSGPPR